WGRSSKPSKPKPPDAPMAKPSADSSGGYSHRVTVLYRFDRASAGELFFWVRLGSDGTDGEVESSGLRVEEPRRKDARFSCARAALLKLARVFMRVIILAGFFLRESRAIRSPCSMRMCMYC